MCREISNRLAKDEVYFVRVVTGMARTQVGHTTGRLQDCPCLLAVCLRDMDAVQDTTESAWPVPPPLPPKDHVHILEITGPQH